MTTRTRWFAVLALVVLAPASRAQVLGPTPYLSAADSPFVPSTFHGYFHLEDMQDGFLNTPGVNATLGMSLGPSPSTDSVDADDGSIDGSGLAGTSFLIAGSGNPTGAFQFDAGILGRYPTHVGIVVTDAYDPVFFEAIAYDGTPLGVTTITGYGPPPDTQGQTAEDRFIGFVHAAGIREIHVATGGNGGIEVDHIQYGALEPAYEPFCFGDGTGTPCPCGNTGTPGNGCGNSVYPGGAHFQALGQASLSHDTATLYAAGLPASPSMFFQGTTRLNLGYGVAFGDGLRCVGGSIIRLALRDTFTGGAFYPGPGDQPISIRGGVAAGQTRYYQVIYRNAANFCTPALYNLTNAVSILWSP